MLEGVVADVMVRASCQQAIFYIIKTITRTSLRQLTQCAVCVVVSMCTIFAQLQLGTKHTP